VEANFGIIMKITRLGSKTNISLSKSEWLRIGSIAGWVRSPEVLAKLEESKQESIKIAHDIKLKLESMGYIVPEVNIKDIAVIKTIKDGDGFQHNVDIEFKPWANKNNDKFELRNGVTIIAGPYFHRRFRRRRFNPTNADKMIEFLKRIFKYTIAMDRIRKKRTEKYEKDRTEKFEIAMKSKTSKLS